MARPHLSLLGGFDFSGDGQAPVFTRKARAVVAYLALQSGQSQSRDKLGALLWGGNGELQARVNLRQALSTIRRAMPSSNGGRFLSVGDTITLKLDDLEVDVARFEELAAGLTPDRLERAVALYRGDLLDGFSLKEEPFEDWLRVERERLRGIAIVALEKLVAHYSAVGDLARCTRAATRLLALEPLREDIHRALMRVYASEGRFNLALKQYEVCRDALQRELGVQPEPETKKLYEDLRSRRMSSNNVARPLQPETAGRRHSGLSAARPQTHYVKSGGCNIAYQVTGDGPLDMIYVPGWVSNLDYLWASPRVTHVLERLGSFCRLILCDKRGTGLSDRNVGFPTLEQRMEDVRAVLDAVGSKRTVMFGSSEGGNMCMLFAATYPERTAALVLNGACAKGLWSEDYPWAKTREQVEEELAEIERHWGEPFDLSSASPSLINDAFEREWFATFLRNSASPTDAIDLWRWNTEIDVRGILSAIHVPTLIVQRTRDRWAKVEEGRYLAAHIPGAKYLELDSDDHVIWGEHADHLVDEMQAFLTGVRPSTPTERVLLTVMAGQVMGTPSDTARIIDQLRSEPLLGESYVKTSDDGFLATFQGPTRAIQCALAIRDRLTRPCIRAAIHTGECEKRGGDLSGTAIQLASHLLGHAQAGEIIASRTVRDLVVGSGFAFEDRGTSQFGGIPGIWQFYSVDGSTN